MDAPEQQSELSFEAALARLEEIVRMLERGEAPLDQSIELYQEGDRLKRHCEARLKAAQARIEQIAFGADGQPVGRHAVRCRLRRSTAPASSSTPRSEPRLQRNRRSLRAAARVARRRPRRPVRGDAPCRDRRRQAASAAALTVAAGAPVRDRPGSGAAGRRGDRGDPRLFADPRRLAVHGR